MMVHIGPGQLELEFKKKKKKKGIYQNLSVSLNKSKTFWLYLRHACIQNRVLSLQMKKLKIFHLEDFTSLK